MALTARASVAAGCASGASCDSTTVASVANGTGVNDTVVNQLLSILNRAKGFFVIGNTDGYVTDEHGDAAELLHARRAAVEADDRATLIRCLVLSKLLTPRRMPAVSVQLGTCAAKRLALGLRAKAVVALSELKSAILAQACTRCFGLPTLLSNMVYAEHNAGTTAASRPRRRPSPSPPRRRWQRGQRRWRQRQWQW